MPREFLELAFECVDLNWQDYVEIDPRYYRPSEVNLLLGDYSKAKDILGWEPQTTFRALARIMVEADCQLAVNERLAKEHVNTIA